VGTNNPAVTTNVVDRSGTNVTGTTVALGSTLHDTATVGPQLNNTVITGTLTYSFFSNGTCSGTPTTTQAVTLATGIVPDSGVQTPPAGSYSYQGSYGGDAHYQAATSSCEPFNVAPAAGARFSVDVTQLPHQVVGAFPGDPTLTTQVEDSSGTHITNTTVALGTIILDTAAIAPVVQSFTVNSDTSITAISPPGKGSVPVTVTSPGGTSPVNPNAMFGYGPVVALVEPNYGVGSGGTRVIILGSDFKSVTAVNFGTTAAPSFKIKSATKIIAITPAGTGVVDVTVQSAAGKSPIVFSDQFDFAPTVVALLPNHGKAAGGTKVTIVGTNFTAATGVHFGSKPATSFTLVSAKKISAVSPPGTGTVDVTVVSLGGNSPMVLADQFTYR
jgi:hypothetical protein